MLYVCDRYILIFFSRNFSSSFQDFKLSKIFGMNLLHDKLIFFVTSFRCSIKFLFYLNPKRCRRKVIYVDEFWRYTQLTIYGCSNVSTTLGGSCENVGTLSSCNIFQESSKSVATTLPQNVVQKNISTTLWQHSFHNVEVLRYHNVVETFLQYGKMRLNNIRICFRK